MNSSAFLAARSFGVSSLVGAVCCCCSAWIADLARFSACSLRLRSVGKGLLLRVLAFLFSVQYCLSHVRACSTASVSISSSVARFRFLGSLVTAGRGSCSGGSGVSRCLIGCDGCDFG